MSLKILTVDLGALLGIFMLGGVAVIASIMRLYALWVYKTTKDVAYDAILVSIWIIQLAYNNMLK